MLLCEQNFRDVWRRNEIERAEIGQIVRAHTHTHTHTHTHAAKLVVEIMSACFFHVIWESSVNPKKLKHSPLSMTRLSILIVRLIFMVVLKKKYHMLTFP